MQVNERIKQLLDRYQTRSISESEFDELLIWMQGLTAEQEQALAFYYQPLWEKAKAGELLMEGATINWETMKASIFSHKQSVPIEDKKVKRLWWRIAAAAVLVIGLGLTYLLVNNKQETEGPISKTELRTLDKILPNSNQTTLTLADGRIIVLDSSNNGELLREGNVKVVKLQTGEIAYNTEGSSKRVPEYHTIAVPRGGRPYQLLLEDGSKVWLNAASSLRYPDYFSGDTRTVEITGEAYFQVNGQQSTVDGKMIPFVVSKGDMSVTVLGTHFNVNTYEDENDIRVTLLEGSVKVNKTLIKPGEQTIMDRNNNIRVAATNTDLAVAWVKGYFQFDKADVKTILRQVGRWYDLDIEYAGALPGDLFSGKIERNLPLTGIVKLLDPGKIHIRVEGKKLIVE